MRVHFAAGSFLPNGAGFALTLLGAAVALALAGPGALSLDAAMGGVGRGADQPPVKSMVHAEEERR